MHADSTDLTFTETARRAQIQRAAITTINALGYHGTSLAEIAERAGVAKSAIAYYFGSKESLLMVVLSDAFASLGEKVARAVGDESDLVKQLHAYAHTMLEHFDAHRAEMAAAVTIVVNHRTADGTPLYLVADDEDTAFLRDLLVRGMEAGVFRAMALSDAVVIVESLLHLVTTEVQRDLNADLTTLIPETIGVLMRGIVRAEHLPP